MFFDKLQSQLCLILYISRQVLSNETWFHFLHNVDATERCSPLNFILIGDSFEKLLIADPEVTDP